MSQAKPVDQQPPSQQRPVLLAVDLKNSVLIEVDAGNLNLIAYSPYGQQSSQLGVMTRLGFNGELREVKPEWYLLGNGYRAYNPQLMRFQSPDSLSPFEKGGLNAYMYCGGEPVMNSDPTGKSIWAFSRALQRLTERVTNVATQTVKTTAYATKNAINSTTSLIGSSASKMSAALGNAKKSVIAATVGSEPFPVPPSRVVSPPISQSTASRSFGYSHRPNQARQQINSAQEKPAVSTFRGRTKAEKPQIQSSNYDHVQTNFDARQHTSLLNKGTGEVVAIIRTT
ncbi:MULTISPECIES: RHS repeat-associated core domain-containing protein [Pseudomonas]|jgi:RHS repeat-associated protein|uniref:RHS repeat-associated core domain-containing protein n=1 Tax=Pseudomonas monachiensis TaxID=3060212 RepID=A0ABW9HEJ9_9PSED|nr:MULTISPECIES: RHS repeat-associated core domain-containing protein [unclassified Pseudomonas]